MASYAAQGWTFTRHGPHPRRSSVRLHRAAAGGLAGGHRRRRRRVLRRPAERAGLADHLRRRQHRVPPGLGLVAGACLLGLLFYLRARVERIAMPWRRPHR